MKKLCIIFAVALIAISVFSCTKNYTTNVTNIIADSTRNDMGIKNPVTVHILYSGASYLYIYANGQSVSSVITPDSIIVPDSSYLYARWGTNHADTIATQGLIWTIGQ